tara:strand:- start:7528 stop:8391 length:864 start_codon:yes stop_codon:yes gene_type:complete
MKILIVGDLHGQKPKIYFKDFDAIIAPGDFCSDAPRKYMFQALRRRLADYNYEGNWVGIIGKKRAKPMVQKSLRDGKKILEFLNSFGKPVFTVPGNWDWTGEEEDWAYLKKNYYKTRLIRDLKNIRDVYHRIRPWNGFDFIGHGITSGPEYPQYKQDLDRYDEKELKKLKRKSERLKIRVSGLFKKSKNPIIYLSHNVPFRTSLDKIDNKESPRNGDHFGSTVSKNVIKKYKPLLCIGGHMHEHFGKCKIGKTIVINSGFGKYVNTLIELDEEKGKVKKITFKKGRK